MFCSVFVFFDPDIRVDEEQTALGKMFKNAGKIRGPRLLGKSLILFDPHPHFLCPDALLEFFEILFESCVIIVHIFFRAKTPETFDQVFIPAARIPPETGIISGQHRDDNQPVDFSMKIFKDVGNEIVFKKVFWIPKNFAFIGQPSYGDIYLVDKKRLWVRSLPIFLPVPYQSLF